MSKPLSEIYIGDGVYAHFSGCDVRLFTQEGNEIFLEYPMLDTLKDEYNRLVDQHKEKAKEGK